MKEQREISRTYAIVENYFEECILQEENQGNDSNCVQFDYGIFAILANTAQNKKVTIFSIF
jgi:hypothetical protein